MTRTRAVRLLVVLAALAVTTPAAPSAPFPEPQAVVNGFYVSSQQLAALHVIETVILEKGQPQSPSGKALLARYRAKMAEIRTRNANRPEFYLEFGDYVGRPSFRTDVLHRYLPQYEHTAFVQFQVNPMYRPRPEGPNTNLMVTALAMLAVPVLYLIRGERVGSPAAAMRQVDGQPAGSLQLPESLATVNLFRLRLYCDFECGRIHDDKVETVVTRHSYRKRDRYGTPGAPSPHDYDTSFSSVTYHTLSLTTPDGRELRRVFTNNEFPASVGHVMSAISCCDRMLYAFNHTTGNFVSLHGGVGQTLRMRAGRGLWGATIGVAAAGGAIVMAVMGGDEAWRAFWAVVLVFGFFSILYIVALKILVQFARRVPFRAIWRPRFQKFMEERTPWLARFYPEQ